MAVHRCVSLRLCNRTLCACLWFFCVLVYLFTGSLDKSELGDEGAEALAEVLVSLSQLEILKYVPQPGHATPVVTD